MQNMSLAITLKAVEKRQLAHFNLVHAAERLAVYDFLFKSRSISTMFLCVLPSS